MASLRKRPKSDFWVCCYTTSDGRRTQRSTGTADKDQAMMVCRQWEGEARLERETVEAAAMDSVRGKGRRLIWSAAAIAVLLQIGALLWFINREPAPVSLLVELDESEAVPSTFMEQKFAKRHRWVRINEDALKAFDEKTWKFELNLFDDEKHMVDVAVYRKHYTGAKSVVGLIENDLHTSVVLSKRDSRREAMAGSVALADGRRFMITHVGDGKHVVLEVDMEIPPPICGLCQPSASSGKGQPQKGSQPEKGGQPRNGKGKGVGANDHRHGKPQTEFALNKKEPRFPLPVGNTGISHLRCSHCQRVTPSDKDRPKKEIGVGANDYHYGKPQTEFARSKDLKYPFPNSMGLARKMVFTAANTPYGFYGRGIRGSKGGGGSALTQGPTSPARLLYQRPGTGGSSEFIDVLFVYEQALLASFVDLADMQLKLDNLIEETNLIFRKCLIPLEVRQAILDPDNLDPATGEPLIDQNQVFVAKARAFSGGATAVIDGPPYNQLTIGGDDAPAWKQDFNATKPIWNSIAVAPTPKTWTTLPVLAGFSPLYDTPNFAGSNDDALNWISDARNSLIYGDQYWAEPYINFPEGYMWWLLPVALDANATRNIPPYTGIVDYNQIDFTSIENPDIFWGPIDSGSFNDFNIDVDNTAGTVSPWGISGTDNSDETGGELYFTTGQSRDYISRALGGTLQNKPGLVGKPSDANGLSLNQAQVKPNYYIRNTEDGVNGIEVFGNPNQAMTGRINPDTDIFTADEGAPLLTTGDETSLSDPGGFVKPLSVKWLDFGERLWVRQLAPGGRDFTIHYDPVPATRTPPGAEIDFEINATYDYLRKKSGGAAFDPVAPYPNAALMRDGDVFEFADTSSVHSPEVKDRPYYVEVIDANRTYALTTTPNGPEAADARYQMNMQQKTGTGTQTRGIDIFTFSGPGHRLSTGDRVFITDGDGEFPIITGNAQARRKSPSIGLNIAYDVHKWPQDAKTVSLHRINTDPTKQVGFGVPQLAFHKIDGNLSSVMLDQSKTEDIFRYVGGGGTPITPNTSPVIISPGGDLPVDVNTTEGSTVTFAVNAVGSLALTYQWEENSTNPGVWTAIGSPRSDGNFTMHNLKAANNSGYRVNVANTDGNATSSASLLTVTSAASGGGVLAGNELWKYNPTPSGNIESSPAVDANGTVYFGSNNGKIYAVDYNGTSLVQIWVKDLGAPVLYAPLVDGDGIIYVGAGTKVYALDYNGSSALGIPDVKWVYDIAPANFTSSPGMGADGTIFIGSDDNNIYAINGDTNATVWIYPTNGPIDASSPAIGTDGTVYIGSTDRYLYAIDPTPITSVNDTWNENYNANSSSPAFGDDGTIYLGTDDGLYKIDPANPTVKNLLYATGRVQSTPWFEANATGGAPAGSGTIYFGSDDNKIYAVNTDGALKWIYDTNGSVKSSPWVDSNSTVYIGSDDGWVYALNWNASNSNTWTDPRDLQDYNTTKIGGQVWMTENLRYNLNATDSLDYNGSLPLSAVNGKLYTWAGAQAAVPAGWHIPTDVEWKTLETAQGMAGGELNLEGYAVTRGVGATVGTKLQVGGTSGMNFTLAGFADTNSSATSYQAFNNRTYIWVNGIDGTGGRYRRRLVTGDASVYRFGNATSTATGEFAISVRLIKDDSNNNFAIRKWAKNLGGPVQSSPRLNTAESLLFVGSDDNKTYALNWADGSTTSPGWVSGNLGGEVRSSPVLNAVDSVVYIGSDNNRLHALNVSNGTPLGGWVLNDLGGPVRSSAAFKADGSVVYIGSDGNRTYGLDAITGGEVWRFDANGSVRSTPAVDPASGNIYIGAGGKNVYALDPVGGTKLWEYGTGPVGSSPKIVGTTLYVSSNDKFIYALDYLNTLQSATFKWRMDLNASISSSPSIDSNGTIYVGSDDKNLYAIDDNVTFGSIRWTFPTGQPVASSAAIASSGNIYFGGQDGKVYALDSSGTKLWEFSDPPAGGQFTGSLAIGADLTIFAPSTSGILYALDGLTVPKAGRVIWKYPDTTKGHPAIGNIISSPSISNNSVVYFGTSLSGGNQPALHAIASDTGGVDSGPWPKFKANRMNTGLLLPTPTQGLLAYYPFSGNMDDASGNGHIGFQIGIPSLINLTKDRGNSQDAAYLFDYNGSGPSPSIAAINMGTVPDTNSTSVVLWARWDGSKTIPAFVGDDSYMFHDGINAVGAEFALLVQDNGTLRFKTKKDLATSNDLDVTPLGNPLTDNQWHHLAVVADADASNKRIYVDGIIVAENQTWTDISANGSPHGQFAIGAYGNTALQQLTWNGVLDEIRVYNRALSPEEVVQMFSNELPSFPLSNPPVVVTHPQDLNSTVTSKVTFAVDATGSQPLTYQWWMSPPGGGVDVAVSGGTDSSFVINSAQPDSNGTYWCVVSNRKGDTNSTRATLGVAGTITQIETQIVSIAARNTPHVVRGPEPNRVWFADGGPDGYRVRRAEIIGTTTIFSTIAGGGFDFLGNLSKAAPTHPNANLVNFSEIADIAVDGGKGNPNSVDSRVYIAAEGDKVFILEANGTLALAAGGGTLDNNGTLPLSTLALDVDLDEVVSVAADFDGTYFYIADRNGSSYHISRVNRVAGTIERIVGNDYAPGQLFPGLPATTRVNFIDVNATNTRLNNVPGIDDIAVDISGNVYFGDHTKSWVWKISPALRGVQIAGDLGPGANPGGPQAGPPTSEVLDGQPAAAINSSAGVAVQSITVDGGNPPRIYLGGKPNMPPPYFNQHRVRRMDWNGSLYLMNTVAGGGTTSLDTNGTKFAIQMQLTDVTEVAVDVDSNVFFGDVDFGPPIDSLIWKINGKPDNILPWRDGQIVYIVDYNSTRPTQWPALPPYPGLTLPAMTDSPGTGPGVPAPIPQNYSGPYWVNVDEDALRNPHVNKFWLSTEPIFGPTAGGVNGTWSSFGSGTIAGIQQPFDLARKVDFTNFGNVYLAEGLSVDFIPNGFSTCDLIKVNRHDFSTIDTYTTIDFARSDSNGSQVDFTTAVNRVNLSGAGSLTVYPGDYDPHYSGVVGTKLQWIYPHVPPSTTSILTAGALRMALNNGNGNTGDIYFGNAGGPGPRYGYIPDSNGTPNVQVRHDETGEFRFSGELYPMPAPGKGTTAPGDMQPGEENKARDVRADVVCILISGGGGLARFYGKGSRGGTALPNLVEDTTVIGDVDSGSHANVISNRDSTMFMCVGWGGSIPYFTFAHEMGHVLGCAHGIGDSDGGTGPPLNPLDYKTTGSSAQQANITFSPFRNDRTSSPLDPSANPTGLVKDNFLSCGTYFTGSDSSADKFCTIMAYGGPANNMSVYTKVGIFSSPIVYYQGTKTGEQYGWKLPPPLGNYTQPLIFSNARAISTIGPVASYYRDGAGTGRTLPGEVAIPKPPRGVVSASPSMVNNKPKQQTSGPISYAPGVVPQPGRMPPGTQVAAAVGKKGGGGLPGVTNPTPPNRNPGGGLPGVTNPKPGGGLPGMTNPNPGGGLPGVTNPKPGGGLGGTINPAPPPVKPIPGLPNDNYESVWPNPGKKITAPQAVFPTREFAVLDSINRGATRQNYDSPLPKTGGRSVWFRWNAPVAPRGKGQVTFSTKGSDFDTIMKVTTFNQIKNTWPYDIKDNAKTGPWSEGTYPWVPGGFYLICVDGVGGAQGSIRISAKLE